MTMMYCYSILVVAASLVCPLSSLAQETEKWIEFGGPRRATAQIIPNDTVLNVIVEMIAVKSFDKATNKLLSQEKAIRYVQLAIGNYLGKASEKSIRFSLSRMEIISSKINDDRFRFDVRIPCPGDDQLAELKKDKIDEKVKLDAHASEANAANRSPGPTPKLRIFEASEDFCETSQFLLRALKSEIPPSPVDLNDEKRDVYFRSIADLEEKVEGDFDSLVRDVKQCKILLSIEIDTLLKQIVSDRDALNEILRKSVDSLPSSPKED